MLPLSFVGHDLARPECVLACASGRLYASDMRGGVVVIEPDGTQRRIGDESARPTASHTAVMATSLMAWRWG